MRSGAWSAVAALAVVLAGCTTTEIDSGKAEAFLRDNIDGVRSADCPDGVEAKKGDTFECRLAYSDGRRGSVTVRIQNDEGRVAVGPGDVRPAR